MGKKISLMYLTRQNLRHKLFRSIVIVIAIAVVAAILFPATILGESVSNSLDEGTARLGADMMVIPPGYQGEISSSLIASEPSTFVLDGAVVDQVSQIEGVKRSSPQLYFATLASG
jgi:putative ABC transport system permease protein